MVDFLKNVSDIRILVVGDVMLDRYFWGSVTRISPEAPVPVVNLDRVTNTLGGAANVAANIAGLGATAYLVGIVGEDAEASIVSEMLEEQNISADFLIRSAERQTTVKTRVMAHNQQIVRVDQETKSDLSAEESEQLWKSVILIFEEVEIVIVSDYAKGTATKDFLSRLITTAAGAGKSVFADPKGKNYKKYSGATMLTPNQSELAEACGLSDFNQATINSAGNELLEELDLKHLLVTQGEKGMTLFEKRRKPLHLPVEPRNVYDVTGAGDTVIACLAVAMAGGAEFETAAKFANQAAGLVVEKLGTTAINQEMLNTN